MTKPLLTLTLAMILTSAPAHAAADPRDSACPYGALTFITWDHDWNNHFYKDDAQIERAARLMQDAGILFARADFLWADVEPEPGRFDFARLDHVVAILDQHGIKLLATLHYNPAWREGEWNAAPDRDAFVRYARATVRHFKDRIKYWEVWNEPDHPIYWDPQDDLTAYSELLKAVAPAIREEDPTAVVVLGGLANEIPYHLRTLYKKAGRGAFDIVNIHPFVNPLQPNALGTLHGILLSTSRVMEEFGDADKPIWITEIGCPGVAPGQSPGGWWAGAVPNETQQAEWLDAVYRHALQWKGVQKVFWAFLRDTDHHFQNAVDDFGLLRLDFSPKPAYAVYKKIATGDQP